MDVNSCMRYIIYKPSEMLRTYSDLNKHLLHCFGKIKVSDFIEELSIHNIKWHTTFYELSNAVRALLHIVQKKQTQTVYLILLLFVFLVISPSGNILLIKWLVNVVAATPGYCFPNNIATGSLKDVVLRHKRLNFKCFLNNLLLYLAKCFKLITTILDFEVRGCGKISSFTTWNSGFWRQFSNYCLTRNFQELEIKNAMHMKTVFNVKR